MKNKIKRLLVLLLSLLFVVILAVVPVSADETEDLEDFFASLMGETEAEEEAEEEEVITSAEMALEKAVSGGQVISVENSALSFQLDKATGQFYITDKASGKVWTSNPYNASEDEVASGITRTNLLSQIVVTYIERKSLSVVNNYAASTNKDGATYTVDGNSIRAEYNFVNEGFTIPLEYSLTKNGFEINVLFEEIKDTAERRIHKIDVLPYFAAATVNDKGYMFIPDGSGALVNLNSPKVDNFPYEKDFYGGDRGLTPNVSTSTDKNLMLPVYGMKIGDNAFIATVKSGAETASLYACVAGKQSNFNRIYTQTVYRVYDTVNLKDAIGSSVYAKYTALNATSLKSYCVSYTLLSGKKADYIGMAEVVREHLVSSGFKEKGSETNLFVDFYGATLKEKAFLGIRYTGVQKLTTFSQAKTILEALKKEGVKSITAGYHNFSSSDYKNKLACKVVPDSKLGGKKAYSKLVEYSKDNDINIYPYADFTTFQKNGNSYWSSSDVVLGLELSMTKLNEYTINDGQPLKSEKPWYLVAPDRYGDAKKQILSTLKKYGSTGILFDESANYIYNDFSPEGYQADRAVTEMQEIYASVAEQGQKLLLSAPNFYALIYADSLTDIPMNSSQYVMFDKDVPFLQIVLKGMISYSSEALNIDGLSDTTILKLIETGSNPKFALIYENGDKLLGTDLDQLYGATYTACMSDAVSYYNELSAISKKTENSHIVGHTEVNGLTTVKYENGVTIYLNYSNSQKTAADGTNVSALGYSIKG